MPDVAIVGIGALGCLFAAYLAPHVNVTMLGHWSRQLRALQEGLTLITTSGEQRRVSVKVAQEAKAIFPATYALVLVKSYQTAQAAREVALLLADDGLAITLQNGLGNEQLLATALGAERVILGSTTEGATLVDVGVVRHAGKGQTILQARRGERATKLSAFAGLLRQAGFDTKLVSNVETIVWEKLAVNAGINPLTALLEAPNGIVLTSEAAKHIARSAATEAALVAQALGHKLAPESAAKRTESVARLTRHNLSSMLQDVRNGRPTELEAITGAILQLGRANGVATPVNSALYDLLSAKLSGRDRAKTVASLPSPMQPLFSQLFQEVRDESR